MRTEKIDVRVNTIEKARIERIAADRQISVSELVREMMRDAINRNMTLSAISNIKPKSHWDVEDDYKNNLDDL